MIFLKQIKIYFNLIKNFNKIAKIKSVYFFIFTMPIFGYIFYLFGKLIIKTNSKKFIIFFFQHKIFLSTIRFFDVESLKKISEILPAYNELNEELPNGCVINNLDGRKILKSLKENGHVSLGKVFKDSECVNLIQHLENKPCYNSQSLMQSNGVRINFYYKNIMNNTDNKAYYSFYTNITDDYKPLKQFLENKNFINLIDNYLNFKSILYSSLTWFNPPTNEDHYVYRNHRDHDDFKHLGMIIYWTNTDIESGATRIWEKSHIKDNQTSIKNIEGPAGTVHLVDFRALHAGTNIKKKERFTTFLRFGKFFNHGTVIDGWSQTPSLFNK